MTARACIFCGERPTTQEHVFSQWLGQVLAKDPRGLKHPLKHQILSRQGLAPRVWNSNKLLDFVASCVCAKCNNGWMSEIESAAKPILTPMIMGESTTLDLTSQRALAAWLGLKAIVTRYVHQPVDPVPREWLDYYYKNHLPPNTWYEWITRYHGGHPLHYEGRDITILIPDTHATEARGTEHGVLATFVIGYFAAKVFGICGGAPTDPGTKYIYRIWPSTSQNYNWPPQISADDGNLEQFINMYAI